MSFTLSRRDVESAYQYANRNLGRIKRDPDNKEYPILNKLLDAGVIVGSAGVVGVASGRFGSLNLQGTKVPLDAAGGVALHLLAFWLDGSDKESMLSHQMHNMGTGVLAAYATKMGVGYGGHLAQKAGKSVPAIYASGEGGCQDCQEPMLSRPTYDVFGAASPAGPLTEAELAALAQKVTR